MKRILIALLLFSPLAFAASDCAHSCCRTYNGQWDDDFDNCFHPKAGYDECKAQCEAQAIANGPQHLDTTGYEKHECKVGFILPAILVAAMLARMR